MKHLLLAMFAVTALVLLGGCGKSADTAPRTLAVCGVPPVAYLAEYIAGGPVESILPEGRSPHDFAPQPAMLRNAVRARLFLSTGMPFEEQLAKAMSGGIRIVPVAADVKRLPLEEHEHHHAEHGHHAEHDGHDLHAMDPHVWLAPGNCLLIARRIRDAFAEAEPERKAVFDANYRQLADELQKLDAELAARLKPCAGKTFFVYHPAFGYFAAAYGLHQKGIELDGREPSPARLAEIIREAREHGVKTIFVQPQFNPASAAALARAIGGTVAETDPLQRDVPAGFRKTADAIVQGFGGK